MKSCPFENDSFPTWRKISFCYRSVFPVKNSLVCQERIFESFMGIYETDLGSFQFTVLAAWPIHLYTHFILNNLF